MIGVVPVAAPPRVVAEWREVRPSTPQVRTNLEREGIGFAATTRTVATGTELVTTRIGDGAEIARIPFTGRLGKVRGFAAWEVAVRGAAPPMPFDVRTGTPIPDGATLQIRFGATGRLDLFDPAWTSGTTPTGTGSHILRRANADGSFHEVALAQMEIAWTGFAGTEDGPMAFRFDGSNTWEVVHYLVDRRLRLSPVFAEALYDLSVRGFLVGRRDGDPTMGTEYIPERPDLTLVDPDDGRLRWTRARPEGTVRWCGEFPIVARSAGVAVLSPSTGRARLAKPYPIRGMRLLEDGSFGVFDTEGTPSRAFRLVVRRV